MPVLRRRTSRIRSIVSSLVTLPTVLVFAACADSPVQPVSNAATPGAAALLTFRPPPFTGCQTGTQPGGALYQLCFPPAWNGDVVYWAHGYVSAFEPIAIPDDAIDGTPIAQIITALGYGFATTSYRRNGLAADVAVADLEELAAIVEAASSPGMELLAGASEGGLSTALALERGGTPFDGGLETCGPVGSFRGQVNHFGDFRAIFDVYFRHVLPGDATTVPQEVRDHWETVYVPRILAALAAEPAATRQLLAVTRAPVDANDPTTIGETVTDLLWYNVFAADDAVARLGGNPFDNRFRWYFGSTNDFLLNLRVRRYTASPRALAALAAFETSGRLTRPVQALHTTGDPIIPFWQQPLYATKVLFSGGGLNFIGFPVSRYGHCAFTANEALASFALLVLRVSGRNLLASADAFPDAAARANFVDLARKQGAEPVLVPRAAIDRAMAHSPNHP